VGNTAGISVTGLSNIGIGTFAGSFVTANHTISLGSYANASANDSAAFGRYATTSVANQFVFGNSALAPATSFIFGTTATTQYRLAGLPSIAGAGTDCVGRSGDRKSAHHHDPRLLAWRRRRAGVRGPCGGNRQYMFGIEFWPERYGRP
jgi:hypothetical protein